MYIKLRNIYCSNYSALYCVQNISIKTAPRNPIFYNLLEGLEEIESK